MEFIDYYQVLGVSRKATGDEIKSAYRKLARKWHPDSYSGDNRAEAERNFQRASEAYEVLSDPDKRLKYDRLGRNWKHGAPFTGGGPGGGPGGGGRSMSPEEFEQVFGGRGFSDFFASVFGDEFATAFGGQATGPGRVARGGADVRATISVPVTLAVLGGERSFEIDGRVSCPACGGAGRLAQDHICPACGGVGQHRNRRTVRVKIPPDIRDGQVMRLKGLGEPGIGGGERGDLHLVVKLAGDEALTPDGDDLIGDLPLAPWEVVLGTKVPVRTPGGEVLLTVPPDTPAGAKLRVRGHGLYRAGGGRGDFLARVKIVLPARLTDEQRDLLRKIGEQGETPRGGVRAASSTP